MKTKNNEELFMCIEDLQEKVKYPNYGGFSVGARENIEGWRKKALIWAKMDGNVILYEPLTILEKEKVIGFIEDNWDLKIIPISLEMEKILEDIEKKVKKSNQKQYIKGLYETLKIIIKELEK